MKKSLKEYYQWAKEIIFSIEEQEPTDFRLEQLEYGEEDNIISIVVSFLVDNLESTLAAFNKKKRLYKEIKFESQDKIKGVFIYN